MLLLYTAFNASSLSIDIIIIYEMIASCQSLSLVVFLISCVVVPVLVSSVNALLTCQSRDDLNSYFDLLRINQSSSSLHKWMGGDISTSIPLQPISVDHINTTLTPYLWLFGDTCVGHLTSDNQSKSNLSMIKKFQFTSNTVAIQTMISSSSHAHPTLLQQSSFSFDEPQFYLPLHSDGSVNTLGVFIPLTNSSNVCPSPVCKYWCVSGIHLYHTQSDEEDAVDTLVLFCQTPTQKDLASQVTSVLYINNIKSPNLTDKSENKLISINPLEWAYQSTFMPPPYSGHDYGWGTSVTKNHEDGLIYMVGQNNSHTNLFDVGIYLSRISEEHLLSGNWYVMEVFCNNNLWLNLNDCLLTHGLNNLIGFPSSYTETSLVYSDIIQQWLLLLLDTNSNTVYIALTQTLSEPMFPTWKVVPIYDIQAPFNNKSAGLFNYAAKIHPQFSTLSSHSSSLNSSITASLVFSFNTNGPFNTLNSDLDIYHPHFVECQLEL